MRKIGIIVGEDADLPQNLIKKNRISVFPFVIEWDKFKNGINIYKLMRVSKNSGPKTSQPSPKVFKDLIEKKLKECENVLVITISSKFSGTYNSARQALKLLSEKDKKRVLIFDSEYGSGAEALLVLKALKLISENKNLKTIASDLKKFLPTVSLVGVFNDPKWLVLGGRISSIKGVLVKNMIKSGFRPVLTIRNGEIVVKKIQMNAANPAQALFSQFKDEVNPTDKIKAVITHADCKSEAKNLYNLLAKFSQSVTIEYVHEISPVVGCHLGPDTLLLSWTTE